MQLLLDFKFVKVFVDDILVFSDNNKDHMMHLNQVLEKLRTNNLSINFKKSKSLQKEVTYLGCIISEQGIKPNVSRVPKVEEIEAIKTRKYLQKLLGFINCFRLFIKNLSVLLSNINSKTKKDLKFSWTDSDQKVITNVISEILMQPTLHHPDFKNSFELYTDASDNRLGAVLIQQQKVVVLYSCKLSQSEKNYTATEKKFLAIYKSLENFRQIIFNSHIDIFSDHKNNIFESNTLSNRMQR